ncbi:MAG TPA: neutral zinc metallopeptidase [Dongiaceae bacterium]|nr:neutral zinc metallopeptidase [Dongiaceae bacterium]
MLWRGGRRSDNIEDRRGYGGGFGGGGMRMGGGIGGIGLLIVIVIGLFFGVDPATLLSQLDGGSPDIGYQQQDQQSASTGNAGSDEEKDFVSAVLADTEDTWSAVFRDMGRTYVDPHLVLFAGQVQSACGFAETAMGPFYCPGDSKVYIDLGFYDELKQRLGAPGDFAQAYVIAHEVGHHVQHLLGITDKVDRLQGSLSESQANALSVRVELQADCFAGVWAYHAKEQNIVEPGDIDEALNAAAAVGDDRLQRQGQGYVVPDSFTHGSSAQRVRWFKAGFARGELGDCDTFGAKTL